MLFSPCHLFLNCQHNRLEYRGAYSIHRPTLPATKSKKAFRYFFFFWEEATKLFQELSNQAKSVLYLLCFAPPLFLFNSLSPFSWIFRELAKTELGLRVCVWSQSLMSKKVPIISKVRSGDMDTQQIQARTHQHVYSQKLTETLENRLTKK